MAILVCCGTIAVGLRADPAPGAQSAQTVHVVNELKYLLYLPDSYAKDPTDRADGGRGWPLVLFLHGAGERGEDLNIIKRHGLPKLIDRGAHEPFILIAPQCATDGWWDADVLQGLIDATQKNLHVDPSRLYCTGLSMGGFGTWMMVERFPGEFAAVAPICGGGDAWLLKFGASAAKHLPVWAFHGEADPVVPIHRTEEMVQALQSMGDTDVKFTRYPGVGHDSWTRAYDDPDLIPWLLSHRKTPAP